MIGKGGTNNINYKMTIQRLILGSKSPRRQELISSIGLPVEIRTQDVDETYPESLSAEEVPVFLAQKKAIPLIPTLSAGDVLVTSDTIVELHGEILGKPSDSEDAFRMLKKLSGNTHRVISGVTFSSVEKQHSFQRITTVSFRELSNDEITYYIDNYSPLDKAGAYGIQEWIGTIGVLSIEGSYLNVVGLPVADLIEELKTF
ncbi:Maf-like protein [Wandonia haliotis]|uniref:dTTP/UTP pyrophosphatase n=1 Tax=Wandonia haliotis TaxID=574963 RepID=A0ABN1MQN9_9FLAO